MGKRDHHHRLKHITIILEQLVPQDHLVCKLSTPHNWCVFLCSSSGLNNNEILHSFDF